MTQRTALAVIFFSVFSASYVQALELGVSAAVGAEHTDNTRKTDQNAYSDLERRASVDVDLKHKGERLAADLSYSAERMEYDRNTQEDRNSVQGDALLQFEQIEQTLLWHLSNSRRNVVRDKSLSDIQDNREDRSISTAGVDYTLRPSKVDSIVTGLTYADIQYQDSTDLDSERAGGNVSWNHSMSSVDMLFLRGQYEDVTFNDSAKDYDYYSAGLGYRAQLSRLNYELFAGYNEQDRSDDTVNGMTFSLLAKYESGGSNWTLDLAQQLTDTSKGNNNGNIGDIDNSGTDTGAIDVYELITAQLGYQNNLLCSTCVLDVSALVAEENYEEVASDNREASLSTRLSYRFTQQTQFSGEVRYSQFSFFGNNPRVDYDRVTYRVGVDQQVLRDLFVALFVQYEEQTSDLTVQEYNELRGGLSLRYQFL